MSRNNTILKFTNLLSECFLDLKRFLSSDNEFNYLLNELGWDINLPASDFSSVVNKIELLYQQMAKLDDESINLDDIITLIALIKDINNAIDTLNSFSVSVPSSFLPDIKESLLDYLLVTVLQKKFTKVYQVLYILEIIRYEFVESTAPKIEYTKTIIDTTKLKQILKEPDLLIKSALSWVTNSSFPTDKVIYSLYRLLNSIGVTTLLNPGNKAAINSIPNALYIHLFSTVFSGEIKNVGIEVTGNDEGVVIKPAIPQEIGVNFNISDTVNLRIFGESDFLDGFSAYIHTGGVDFGYNSLNTLENKTNYIKLGLETKINNPENKLIINSSNVSLGYKAITFILGLIYNNNETDIRAGLKFDDLKLTLSAKDTDSFLGKVLGNKEKVLTFQTELLWSSLSGFHFTGSGDFEIAIPTKIDLDFLKFENIVLSLKLPSTSSNKLFSLEASTDIKFDISSISLTITQFGIALYLKENQNSSGRYELDFGAKMPTAIGLSIETPTVMGGGYLEIKPDKYSGIFELKFIEKVTVRILGILNTKLPGGKEGYSLLLLVFVEKFQPVQLGFGFTLNGVGGLLGLNRTANVEKLRSGVRDGSLKSTLFPTDVIKNANRIISDLESLYPASEGRFLIGPMAKIGWGSPQPLITIDLGLIIELPEPVTVVILGVIRAVLPEENNALLKLQINFLGVIEFAKKSVSFDATIEDSYLLTYKLYGDMAFRLNWGDQPNFLLTVGGFHPQFTPPPMNLPEIRRITVSIAELPNLKISLETYFAVTTNTVQTGAKLYGRANQGKFSAEAIFWFDVLIQFNPFYFIAEIGASAAIKRGSTTLLSAYLRLTVSGPKPWTVNGKVEFKAFGIKAEINVNESWNKGDNPSLPDEPVWPLLDKAIDDANNWRALLPERNTIAVSVKKVATATGEVVVHPMGSFGFSQAVVPMDVTINKFGTVKPADYNRFWVDSAKDALNNNLTFTYLEDNFAPAQYRQMSDQDKLGEKSFQKFKSGMRLGTESLKSSYWVMRDVSHPVERIIDRRMKKDWDTVRPVDTDLFNTMLRHNEVAKSPVSPVRNRLPYDAPTATTVGSNQYRVVNKNSLSPYDSLVFDNTTDANNYLVNIVSSDPYQENKLFVIDTSEL